LPDEFMADVISWPGDLATLHDVCDRLRSGQLVGVPSDDGLDVLAFGLDEVAVKRLGQIRSGDVPLAVALGGVHEVLDWLPNLRGPAIRLVRDFWPGPMTLVSLLGSSSGLLSKLPSETQNALRHPAGLAVRLVRDDLAALIMSLGGPAVIGVAPSAERLDVVLENPAAESVGKVTVVAAGQHELKLLCAGALRPAELESSRRAKVVFVCTGNTCRSPMAEGLCRKLLADTLGVSIDQLAARGYEIESAGLAAADGDPASPEAVEIARGLGFDLADHASQPLTMELVDRADWLFTMTHGHLRMLHSLRLPVGPEPQMLSMRGHDVPDPIGGPLDRYRECAEQISASLRERLPQLLEG
jgi:protein-tyrosine-phosphatase